MTEKPNSTIVIIGAGIIALTTALRLLSELDKSNFDILIVSQEWPSSVSGASSTLTVNYASMWAGAHVRPIPASTNQLTREAAWLRHTVNVFKEQSLQPQSIGVTSCKGIEFLEAPTPDYERQTAQSFAAESGLQNFRKYGQDELPDDVQLGYEYDTYCVDAPVYCTNLLRFFIVQGGRTLRQKLTSEWEGHSLSPNVELVINCSGIGFGDPKCFPTRGQTVLTNFTSATKTVTRQQKDGSWSFVIPRFLNGGTIVGGTKQPRDWTIKPLLSTRSALLNEVRSIAPYAVSSPDCVAENISPIADVVGRRPTREGGMRIELERQTTDKYPKGSESIVVHAYGAGGRGFEISWGVAEEVVRLVKAALAEQQKAPQARL